MDILPFSQKGLNSIKDCGFLTVWEGAVRSSKTIVSVYAFMVEVLNSLDNRHLMIGKDLSAIMGNCIDQDYGLIALSGGGAKVKRDEHNKVYIDLYGKRIDIFGGDKINSFRAFRGRSYGMAYIDEANLQHQNTINEVFNRTIASKSRKHFMTLNPDSPGHWLYTDYLDRYEKELTAGYKWFHFTLDDNPAITEERKQELIREYKGHFYKKYILGLRVKAEGSCFPSFSDANIIDKVPNDIRFCNIGVDIGGSKSATVFTLTGFYFEEKQWKAVVIDELYDIENKDTETIIRNYKKFVDKHKENYVIADCYVDSAEQLILKSIRNTGILNTHNSLKKRVVDRIRFTDYLYSFKRLHIMRHCNHIITAVHSAVWNSKADIEERLDDGTYNVDSLDSFEYSIEARIKDFNIGVKI